MKIGANDIRVGNVLAHEGKSCVVLKTMHTQPGKGGAFMQVEMKDIRDGTKFNIRFRSSETVTKLSLEQKKFQYLYSSGDTLEFMDNQTYESFSLDAQIAGDDKVFLQDNMDVSIEYCDDEPTRLVLPEHMTFAVVECEPVVKGQTATSSYKPAILENGVKIMVPQFVHSGDRVIVRIETREYIERAK
jgi:elongation factor P